MEPIQAKINQALVGAQYQINFLRNKNEFE